MKTPEEIKKTFRSCVGYSPKNVHLVCRGCSYNSGKLPLCRQYLFRDAIAYIEQLEERIGLMLIQMHGYCWCCAYKGRPSYKSPCTECLCGKNRPMWEYEGFPDEKKVTKDEQNERGQADHHRSGR